MSVQENNSANFVVPNQDEVAMADKTSEDEVVVKEAELDGVD